MMLGINYETALEQAKKNAFGDITRFEYGPVRFLFYRDLKQDKITVDEAGIHTDCGDVELLFVNDKLVFSFSEAYRNKNQTRESLMAWNYATDILLSAAWCFDEAHLQDDPTIDDEIKRTANWLNDNAEGMRDLVRNAFVDFVVGSESYWDLRNAHKYLNVPRDVNDSILKILMDKTREEDFE